MGFNFLNGGLYTIVQDGGRNGHQKSGFHVCGAMDKRAYRIGNLLLGNEENEAVLEFTLMGPSIQFEEDSAIAITGGDFAPTLNGVEVPMYQAIHVKKGDILEFKFAKDGNWGYVAFLGGLDVPLEMGSRSTDIKCGFGGYEGRKLIKGDRISYRITDQKISNIEKRVINKPIFSSEITEIRVVMGPQEDYFTEKGIHTFLNSEYTLTSQSDRMGYRLEGEFIEHNDKGADIISDGIALGSIQVPAHGKPIIMLADRQTTGGYTKIATVVSVDIPKLVQCKFNKKIRFVAVDIETAQKLYLDEEQELAMIKKNLSPAGNIFKKIAAFFKK